MSGPEDFAARVNAAPGLASPLPRALKVLDDVDPVDPKKAPPSARFRFEHHVYVVWRPWEGCGRCKAAIESRTLELPDVGDHVCPHTRRTAYLALLADRALGKCEFTSHEPTTLQSGVIQIALGVAWARSKEELTAMGLAPAGNGIAGPRAGRF